MLNMVEKAGDTGHNCRSPDDSQTGKPKTCVIILGRGNSFTLNTSEVLLLNARRGRSIVRPCGVHDSTPGCRCQHSRDKCATGNISLLLNGTSLEHCSMDALCNDRAAESMSSAVCSSAGLVGDEVDAIWRKTEVIMAAKHDTVLEMLEKFGIDRAWALAEGGVDRMAEEECLWKRVEVCADRQAANQTARETEKCHVQSVSVVTDMLD